MMGNNIPIGYVFKESVYRGQTASPDTDIYEFYVEEEEYTGPVYLKRDFFPKIMLLTRGQTVRDLVVIGKNETGIQVAKENYFDYLLNHYFKKEQKVWSIIPQPLPHLMKNLQHACTYQLFSKSFNLIGRKRKGLYVFELCCSNFRFPVVGFSELSLLHGENHFFPASPYFFEGRQLPVSLYKTDNNSCKMPCYYKGRFVSDTGVKKTVHILLHGFLFPHKWHYNVLKHMFGLRQFNGQGDDERTRWESFEGMKVSFPDNFVLDECKANDENDSCNMANCRAKKLFFNVHSQIRAYAGRFLRKAVTFWAEQTTKKIKVWEGNPFARNAAPHIVEVIAERRVEHSGFAKEMAQKTEQHLAPERHDKLILRGVTYDWKDSNEPTLHINIVTLYAGELRDITPERDRFHNHGQIVDHGNLFLDKTGG